MNVTDKLVVEAINKRLADRGKTLDGRPVWRVSWIDDQREIRKGKWDIITEAGIYLRTEVGIKEVPKYPWIKGCWGLEKIVFLPENSDAHLELVNIRNGSYELIYPFCDSNGNPLPVNARVVEMVLWHLENPTKRFESDDKEEDQKKFAEEVAYYEGLLDETGRTPLFEDEAAVFLDSTKQKGLTNAEPA